MLPFSKQSTISSRLSTRGDSTGTSQPAAASPATANEDGTTTLTLERQDVSTVGKQAGLAPGTRSGLWSFMAAAIEALQPRYVVIENVRGLLSARAARPQTQGATPDDCNARPATSLDAAATLRDLEPDRWGLGDQPARPLRALCAVLGDLADLGMHARWIGLPASRIGAPHHRFRIFILAWRTGAVPDTVGVGLVSRRGEPGSGEARRGTIALSHQIIDFALHGPNGSPARGNEPETLWALIETIFDAGDDTPTPSPDGSTSPEGQHPTQP